MKIVWIFPVKKKCGISMYSHEYCNALSTLIEIETIDLEECINSLEKSVKVINTFDIIHIQYETSFFLHSRNTKFAKLCKKITIPIVTTLHEVYDTFPGTFPRSQIKETGLIRKFKEIIYDKKHPYQTIYSRHIAHNFYSDKIIVHAKYHRNILTQKGIQNKRIYILPHPVKQTHISNTPKPFSNDTLCLGSLGFINQNFDYTLLINVLGKLQLPWIFTWIGGIRRAEDNSLLSKIKAEIKTRKWEDKFLITGWVSDRKREELLSKIDIYLALFSARSSSGSLATALSAGKCIIATSLPYILEIVQKHPILRITSSDSNEVINHIQNLYSKNTLRKNYLNEINKYITNNSYEKYSLDLIQIYKELVS